MGQFNGGRLPKFIDFAEVETKQLNENFITEDDLERGSSADAPVSDTPPADNSDTDVPSTEDSASSDSSDGTEDGSDEGGEGTPEILKVYSASDEDLKELKDSGIELEDDKLPQDALFIKVKTVEGEDKVLKFIEKDEESRIPVEGSEDTFDTELTADNNEHEYSIAAEIKINKDGDEQLEIKKPEDGEDGEEGSEGKIDAKPIEGDSDGGSDTGGEPDGSDENALDDDTDDMKEGHKFVMERKIMNFNQFINRK